MSKIRLRTKYELWPTEDGKKMVHRVKCFKPEVIDSSQLDRIRRRETEKLRAKEPNELKREQMQVFFGIDNDLEFDIKTL